MVSQEEFHRLNRLSNVVIGAAIEVHRELGPGLLESAYEECLKMELQSQGVKVDTQVDLPLCYKGKKTEKVFRIDMLVEDSLIVELNNFNVPVLRDGIKRKVNGFSEYTGIKPVRG